MKISKKAMDKAEDIQKRIIENSRNELEKQLIDEFAKTYRICPECAIPLNDIKPNIFIRVFYTIGLHEYKIKKCKKCGYTISWSRSYN